MQLSSLIAPTPRRQQRLDDAVACLEAAHTAGQIANVDFQDAKSVIGRAIEDTWQVLRRDETTGYHGDTAFWDKIDFLAPQLHTLASCKRRVEKLPEAPARAKILTLLSELQPVADMVADLKSKVVKRQPKPAEDRKPGYQPPSTTTETQKQVVKLLEDITADAYHQLRQQIEDSYIAGVLDFRNVQALANEHGFPLASTDYFVKRAIPDFEARNAVDLVTGFAYARNDEGRSFPQYPVRDDWRDAIATLATKEADQIRTYFVHKNFRKIASVIEAKGNLAESAVLYRMISLRGLRGRLRFTFQDGSGFTVQNDVVWVRNHKGTTFNRFPLTFHDVTLPDGKPMKAPSEKRMNEVFTVAK